MAQARNEFDFLIFGLVLLVAAVLTVPVARRIGLPAIVAYLICGMIVGPSGLAIFGAPESIIPVSELGIVMLLFLIGLELEPSQLVAMRRDIFGLGAAQLILTALCIALLAYWLGLLPWRGAIIAGLALAMSATAIALQILEQRGELQRGYGQRAFAILLFQDMAVVPLLAMLPLLAQGSRSTPDFASSLQAALLIAGAVALIVIVGRYLLNPLFRLLAQIRNVDGARRIPCRGHARRIQLPARAGSRHRAIPRASPCIVFHGHWHDARSTSRARPPRPDRSCSIDHHCA
jgi:glutathione-regulated potassium-efflux system protein KefB